jgi:hypothetical protein
MYSPVGKDYTIDPEVLYYKREAENKTAQNEIKATKVYLYYDRITKKAFFQIFYGWV